MHAYIYIYMYVTYPCRDRGVLVGTGGGREEEKEEEERKRGEKKSVTSARLLEGPREERSTP